MLRPLSMMRWLLMGCLLFAGTTAFGAGAGAASEVHDNAHLFDAPTIEQVNADVLEIKQKFGKDLSIETFAEIPPDMGAGLESMGKDKFFEHWLRREARQAGTNGVFILIVKNPGRVQIGVGNSTKDKAFTYADRDALRNVILAKFQAKQLDAGLIDGTMFVLQKMKENLGDKGSAPTTGPSTAPATQTAPATSPAASAPSVTEPKPDAASKPDESATPKAAAGTAPAPDTAAKPDADKTAPSANPETGAKPDAAPKSDSGAGAEQNK